MVLSTYTTRQLKQWLDNNGTPAPRLDGMISGYVVDLTGVSGNISQYFYDQGYTFEGYTYYVGMIEVGSSSWTMQIWVPSDGTTDPHPLSVTQYILHLSLTDAPATILYSQLTAWASYTPVIFGIQNGSLSASAVGAYERPGVPYINWSENALYAFKETTIGSGYWQKLSSDSSIPIGAMTSWSQMIPLTTEMNREYLRCNGTEVLVASYQKLHAVIGDTFGAPTNSNYFKLPLVSNSIIKYM